MRTVVAVVAFALIAREVVGQPAGPTPVPPIPAPLTPGEVVSQTLPAGSGEVVGLPGGKDVSQPLQPVGPMAEEPPTLTPTVVTEEVITEVKLPKSPRVNGPLGPSWDVMELLYWWPTRQPIPPIVYGEQVGLPSLPGQNRTQLLAGGNAIDSQPSAGGRFTIGRSISTNDTFGLEATYFFLGTRTFNQNVRNYGGSSVQNFGLQYTNAATGANEILSLAQTGSLYSTLDLSTAVRVQGWEVNSVANVLDRKYMKLNALLGWRYFMVNEGLRIEQMQYRYAGSGGIFQTADQIDAHNRFHGGQLGLHADVHRGFVFCEMTAKVAFGQNYEVVKTEGMTNIFTPGMAQSFGGSGIYVQPSNFGREARGVFAVVPEGTIKFGFRLGDAGRVYVGYSFIYLSDAVRPGDQIDRTLNPSQVPLVSGTAPVYTGDRPARQFNNSDFWVQGLVIGLETRY